jgi:hypothetical protein
MMSQALTAAPGADSSAMVFTLPSSLQSRDVNYFTLIEKYKLQERTMHRLEELKSGNTLSDLSASSSASGPHSASFSGSGSSSGSRQGNGAATRGGGAGAGTGRERSFSSRPVSVSVSFRDIVEEFALRNDVEFLQKLNPKTGEIMHTEDGKVLWEFNHIVCYIDNNVLYVKKRMAPAAGGGAGAGAGGSSWYPISFDDLLTLSRT